MFASTATTDIGQKNVQACVRILEKLKIPILAQHCGGSHGRRLTFETMQGSVSIEVVGQASVEI